MFCIYIYIFYRVPTRSGNPGKPEKSKKYFPVLESSWNLTNLVNVPEKLENFLEKSLNLVSKEKADYVAG